jgi:hypothetical protein
MGYSPEIVLIVARARPSYYPKAEMALRMCVCIPATNCTAKRKGIEPNFAPILKRSIPKRQ